LIRRAADGGSADLFCREVWQGITRSAFVVDAAIRRYERRATKSAAWLLPASRHDCFLLEAQQ
jgi:hypothetical protein